MIREGQLFSESPSHYTRHRAGRVNLKNYNQLTINLHLNRTRQYGQSIVNVILYKPFEQGGSTWSNHNMNENELIILCANRQNEDSTCDLVPPSSCHKREGA